MPYVAAGQNDVFVSYAQVDDKPVPGMGSGWVCTLVDTLKVYLDKQLGRAGLPAVWRDLQLSGNAPLTPEIFAAVRGSATLLIILSEGYLASPWCCKELEAFLSIAGHASRRVFVVEAMPIDHSRKPEGLRDLIGYPFWVRDRTDGPARTLGVPAPTLSEPDYYHRLNKLAVEMATELRRLQSEHAHEPIAPEEPGLAMTSYEHDLYICFADEDNAIMASGERWVDEFMGRLHRSLDTSGVRQVRFGVMRDPKLSAEHTTLLQKCATVVLVLSPEFVTSPWYTDEHLQTALLDTVHKRLDRVFVVERSKTDRSLVITLDPLRRFTFWRNKSGIQRTLGVPSLAAEPDEQIYLAALSDLTRELAVHLKPPPSEGAPRLERDSVFLAECTADVEDRRLEVLRYLEQAGYAVVPRGRLPLAPQQFDAEASRLIAGARVFVQLLGAPTDHLDTAWRPVQRQLELALGRGCEILQWRDSSISVMTLREEWQRKLFLRNTVRELSIPEFCSEVATVVRPSGDARTEEAPSVFIDVTEKERDRARHIVRAHQHITWDLREAKRNDLKRLVGLTNGVVLYWGDESSVRAQTLFHLCKGHFKVLKKSLTRLVIYDGPPLHKPEFQGEGKWPLIYGRDGNIPEEFHEFVRKLQSQEAPND